MRRHPVQIRVRRILQHVFTLLLLVGLLSSATPAAAQRVFVAQLTGFINGQLRFPKVPLWSKPGGVMAGGHKVAEVQSGTTVKIVTVQRIKGLPWALVTSFGIGQHPNGWVPEVLLRVK